MKRTLDFIIAYSDEHGIAPSMSEMMINAGVRSKSNIHAQVKALEARGYISRIPNVNRAITVLRRPEPSSNQYRETIRALFPMAEEWARHCATDSGPRPHHAKALRRAQALIGDKK